MTYKDVPSVPELQCTHDGQFLFRGKPKKVVCPHTVTGRRATARLEFRVKGVRPYYQAARLVAETWKTTYKDGCCIIYKDGDCHNINAGNLVVTDGKGYDEYMRRNSIYKADTLEERKRKLQLVIDETTMTLHYFNTLDMQPINDHVREYLYPCLVQFAMTTLQFGEKKAMEAVPEVIGTMYEKIMNGMCLYNYERFCKKMLHHLKKTGRYGEYWHDLCKPIQIEVEKLKLDSLWERFKVTTTKQ